MKSAKIQKSMSFRLLAWLLIISQALTSATFADINKFDKVSASTLSPHPISGSSPYSDEAAIAEQRTREEANIIAILNLVGTLRYERQRPFNALQKDVRGMLAGDPAYARLLDRKSLDLILGSLRLDGEMIVVDYRSHSDNAVRSAIIYPEKNPGGMTFSIRFIPETPKNPGESMEPLIGHGFTDVEVDKADITIWSQSEAFSKTLAQLEETIKARAPNAMRAKLLDTLNSFKLGKDGRRLGTTHSRYDSSERYYLGFGTSRSKALATEFFDPTSPLYHYSQEALFHELFHSAFGRADEYVGPHDTATHFQAIQIQAVIFWGLGEDEVKGLTMEGLEKHPANKLGENVRSWKRFKQAESGKVDVPKAMATENWKYLLMELRAALRVGWESRINISELLASCDAAAATMNNRRHPVEDRYPIEKAVTQLSKEEKKTLKAILAGPDCDSIRGLPVVDSILMMLTRKVPDNWLAKQAPVFKDGRSLWVVSSEIYNAGGGLGRVEQSHGLGFQHLLEREGSPLKAVEPYYEHTANKKTGANEKVDYAKLLGVKPEDIKELEGEAGRFEFQVGSCTAVAVCYMAVNKFGMESYLIKGYQKGQKESEVPYYTEKLYSYRDENGPLNTVTLDEFSAFFSRASLELVKRVENKKRLELGAKYRNPAMHFQDGQLGFAPLFRRIYYNDDPVLGEAMIAYSTHTYPNRCSKDKMAGERALEYLRIPREYWKYFYRHYETIVDQTSAGARTADWYGGVSKKHVNDILSYNYDNWGEWSYLNDTMVSVTNGDVREITARKFREIMLSVRPDADVEDPTADDVLATKREAKKLLGLRDDQFVVSFSGRVVKEKASRGRAFCSRNIEEMVKAGIQVVIGANITGDPNIINDFAAQAADIARKKKERPDIYKGNFILMRNCDQDDQRAILAATDIQVQDSDPNTEAAGYSESDVATCGGLQLAPPWDEGILRAQGIPFNPDIPGEGNTIIPKDGNPQSYLDAIFSVLKCDAPNAINKYPKAKTLEELSEYQAKAVPLSAILEYLLTSAGYLRQWNAAVIRKESQPKGLEGKNANEANPLIEQLIKSGMIVEISLEDTGLKAYQVNYVDGYEPGISDPNRYRGPPVDIRGILSVQEERNLLEYIEEHEFYREGKLQIPKFRIATDRAALGWKDDVNHSNIAHAGYDDVVVYMGKGLFKHIFQTGNEALRGEVLAKDEFRHLAGLGHGTDAEYAARLVMVAEAINDLESEAGISTVSAMDAIHKLDLDLIPPVEKGKTLCHIIPIDLIPQSADYNQRSKFVEFIRQLNRDYPESRERIEVITDRQNLAERVRTLAADPNNIVDVALSDAIFIDSMPDVPMLIFEPKDGDLGDFRQLEGIIAALRALHIRDYSQRIAALTSIHKLLTGKDPEHIPAADVSLKEFAKIFRFILPPITVKDAKELQRLNDNLLRLIESA